MVEIYNIADFRKSPAESQEALHDGSLSEEIERGATGGPIFKTTTVSVQSGEDKANDNVEKTHHACKCMACGHEWLVLRNMWTFIGIEFGFPCPKCDLSRGQIQYQPSPDINQDIYVCGCGSTNWHILVNNDNIFEADLFCVGCGSANLKIGGLNDT